jgi:putative phosphoribosyl transferase
MYFSNREEAGRLLAGKLRQYAGQERAIILALPRGGVPVAWQIADRLRLPLDVLLVRKLGLPDQPELAMGAIASGGIRVLNEEVLSRYGISEDVIAEITAREQRELERREQIYRGGLPSLSVQGKIVIVVDDGVATGSTVLVAIAALRRMGAARIIVAAPTIAHDTCERLRAVADEVTAVIEPVEFYGVGQWYDDFSQTTDDEVGSLLLRARERNFAG